MRNLTGSAAAFAWKHHPQRERASTAWRQTADDIVAYLDQQAPLQPSVADISRSYYHRLGRAPFPHEISLARSDRAAKPSNDNVRCVECEHGEVAKSSEYTAATPEMMSPRCRRIKNFCIAKCLFTLPAGDDGFKFWNCLNACMKEHGC